MTDRAPVYTRQISFGNILQILALVIGLGAGWFAMDHRSQTNTEQVIKARAELEEIEVRLREVERDQARADERYSNMLTLLARIDARLERIEAAQ